MRSRKNLPFVLLGAAALIVLILAQVSRSPQELDRQNASPLVRVVVAEPTPYRFTVTAHGSVSPRTESDLIPQVSGEVLWTSPSLVAGGFFERGDVLARVDAADYRVDRESARAVVARAESEYRRAKKELGRQRRLAEDSVASESRIDDAENGFRVAEANLREAQARLERAARDLARTELKAPYRGRVRSENVDVGEFVTRGDTIATVYAVDYAEIRLPVPDRELAYLDVPLVPNLLGEGGDGEKSQSELGAPVSLTAEFAGRMHHWSGTLVRTEAELDPRSRMVHLVARVRDPYGLAEGPTEFPSEVVSDGVAMSQPDQPSHGLASRSMASLNLKDAAPLAVGLFVEAEIEGLAIERVFVLPRDALRENDRVYVVDDDERIQFRNVEVLRRERENIIIGGGLEAGDRVCTTPLQAVINGMQVRVFESNGASEGDRERGLAKRPDEPAETIQ